MQTGPLGHHGSADAHAVAADVEAVPVRLRHRVQCVCGEPGLDTRLQVAVALRRLVYLDAESCR